MTEIAPLLKKLTSEDRAALRAQKEVVAAKAKRRKALEAAVWKRTHRDFRGIVDGQKNILVNGPRGTTLAFLSSLSDAELLEHLPADFRAAYA